MCVEDVDQHPGLHSCEQLRHAMLHASEVKAEGVRAGIAGQTCSRCSRSSEYQPRTLTGDPVDVIKTWGIHGSIPVVAQYKPGLHAGSVCS